MQIKGYKRIPASVHMAIDQHDGDGAYFAICIHTLASVYEKHESLPIECQGGKRIGSCHLDDPDVEKAA